MIGSPIWLPATLIAGLFQSWRTAVQRRVGSALSVNAAGWIRYLYGVPFAWAMMLAYQFGVAAAFPGLGSRFLLFCVLGGFGQIIATNLLLMAFRYRNFVVGTAYAKTEAVQGALLSMLLLGERLNALAWAGIALGVAGVMILSVGGKRMGPVEFVRALGQPAALCGIASGGALALASIAIRRATMEVATPDHVRAALIVLAVTVTLQTVMQGAYVVLRERDQFVRVFQTWRTSGQVGLLSSMGSACWFTGFASAPVALVRIVGQVEVAFTMLFGHFYLGERMRVSEGVGLALVTAGVIAALAGAL